MDEYGGRIQHEFAERLKSLRKAANLTQGQLAEKLCVSRGTISFYENCDRVPDIVFLINVSEFFGVSTSYMLGDTDNLNPSNSEIGNRLNLSDSAIDFFSWNEEFGVYLSDLIDNQHFRAFYNYCRTFLNERTFREYDEWIYRRENPYNTPRCDPYHSEIFSQLSDIDELENYRAYKITELFTHILKEEKCKNIDRRIRADMSENEINAAIKKAERETQQKIDNYVRFVEEITANFGNLSFDADLEIRKLARREAGYNVDEEGAHGET